LVVELHNHIDLVSDPVITDYDICSLYRVVVTSTYLYFRGFTCILNVSGLSLWKQARGTAY
jgi:hypothetical protein